MDDIKHILVLATPMKIQLVGIAVTPAPSGSSSVGFYLTDLEAPTNGITMNCICSTSSGRIFMAGSDGHLYEAEYNLSTSWFRAGSSCSITNHSGGSWVRSVVPWASMPARDPIVDITIDSSRHLLYTRSSNNVLSLYTLGSDGLAVPTMQASLRDPCSSASLMSPANPMLDPRTFAIVSFQAITKEESKRFGLVAITRTGVRLYFIFNQNSYSSSFCLRIAHVRSPPQNPQQHQQNRPSAPFYAPQQQQMLQQQAQQSANRAGLTPIPENHVHTAYYAPGGLYLAAHSSTDEADSLAIMAPDVGKLSTMSLSSQNSVLAEIAGALEIQGTIQAIAEVGSSSSTSSVVPGLNELATQAMSATRAFLVVTTKNLYILYRSRPMDVLASLLQNPIENQSEIGQFVSGFVIVIQRVEWTCLFRWFEQLRTRSDVRYVRRVGVQSISASRVEIKELDAFFAFVGIEGDQ